MNPTVKTYDQKRIDELYEITQALVDNLKIKDLRIYH